MATQDNSQWRMKAPMFNGQGPPDVVLSALPMLATSRRLRPYFQRICDARPGAQVQRDALDKRNMRAFRRDACASEPRMSSSMLVREFCASHNATSEAEHRPPATPSRRSAPPRPHEASLSVSRLPRAAVQRPSQMIVERRVEPPEMLGGRDR